MKQEAKIKKQLKKQKEEQSLIDFDMKDLKKDLQTDKLFKSRAMTLYKTLNHRIKLLSQKLLYIQVTEHIEQAENLLKVVFGEDSYKKTL